MIPIETLRQVTVCYVHGHCPDGLASAMILKDAFRMLGMSPCIEFLVHGTPEHRNAQPPNRDAMVLFCDIAPWVPQEPTECAARIARMQADPRAIVLDHHKGAEDIVRSFGALGVFADEKLEPGVSGAVLAFRCVWERASKATENFRDGFLVQDFAECVGARDTWQTQDPRFQRGQWISTMLMSKPASYWLDGVMVGGRARDPGRPFLSASEIDTGRALFEAHEEAVRQAVEQCVYSILPGETELYVFQEQACGFRLTSDVAESLRGIRPGLHGVVAGFSYVVDKPGGKPRLLYSLRGLGGFDVAAFATVNGGGGHTAAAGFSGEAGAFPIGTPYDVIRARLAKFLGAS